LSSRILVDEIYSKTGNTSALTIDSSGRATSASLPHFFVHKNAAQTASSPGEICTWQNVIRNNGNHWDSTNHRFVAPVSGVYMLCLNWLSTNQSNSVDLSIFINANAVQHSRQPNLSGVSGANHNTNNIVISYYMGANSYADVRIGTYNNNGPIYGDANMWTTFSGHLVG